jgi:monothiol glutaredoxin
MKTIFMSLTFLMALNSCSSEREIKSSLVPQMSVQELRSLRNGGEMFFLFDVRQEWEREIALIGGSHILDEKATKLISTLSPDSLIVFYCRTGRRSQLAAEYFQTQGFTRVFNLKGGIDAWSIQIDPTVARYKNKR